MNQSILAFLLANKPKNYWLYIWSKEGKSSTSKWFDDVEAAVAYAEDRGKKADTYFGIGLTNKKPVVKIRKDAKTGTEKKVTPSQQRLEASEVDGITCLWVDIDYKDSVHKKSNLPPTEEAAMTLITGMPLKASAILHSGHGFQAYWLLDEFYEIKTPKDRAVISNTIQGWQRKIQNLALENGWEVDSTFDLARIYRVNNTFNFKDDPKPVILLSANPASVYSIEDFQPHLEEEVKRIKEKVATKETKTVGKFKLEPDADVPKVKFEALMENNLQFKKTWLHKRKDLRDTSMSSYDLSIATIAAMHGWKDQELVNLIISHRRLYGADLKLREDYYSNTIAKAKDFQVQTSKVDKAIKAEVVPDSPEDNLKNLSTAFGIDVVRVEKYLSEPVQYVIHFSGGRQIELKGSAELMSQTAIRAKIADVLDFRIEAFKVAEWNLIVDKLLASTIKIEVGSDATQLGLVSHYLYVYLEKYIVHTDDQAERALRQLPVVIGGEYCFQFDAFIQFVSKEFNDNFKRSELMQKLTRLGCKGKSKTIKDKANGMTTSRYFWAIKTSFIADHRRVLGLADDTQLDDTTL